MKPRENSMNAHVEVITLEPLQDMMLNFVSAEDVELTCRCIHPNMIVAGVEKKCCEYARGDGVKCAPCQV